MILEPQFTFVSSEEPTVQRTLLYKVGELMLLVRSLFSGQTQVSLKFFSSHRYWWLWVCIQGNEILFSLEICHSWLWLIHKISSLGIDSPIPFSSHHHLPSLFKTPVFVNLTYKSYRLSLGIVVAREQTFKNTNVSSIWSWKRESSFIPLLKSTSVKWNRKVSNETLLRFLLASILHCNPLKHIQDSEVNFITLECMRKWGYWVHWAL